jgi:predicted nucleic acid-binding protein
MNDNSAFIDTNILVYTYSREDVYKRQKSIDALNDYDCIISTQVLNEFCNIGIKKFHFSDYDVRCCIDEILSVCNLALVNIGTIRQAVEVHQKYGFSFYDSLIVSSALECNCKFLLTEDLSDGQIIRSVMVKNIFTI